MTIKWKLKILLKRVFSLVFSKNPNIINDVNFTMIIYRIIFNRKLNLESPKTFNEFISYIKLNNIDEKQSIYVDKYQVRDYIKSTIGNEYLVNLIGIYDCVDELDFNSLPNSFVLKCTHASGFNFVVMNKDKINQFKVKLKLKEWLNTNYYYYMRERQYINIIPRIICEDLLFNIDGTPINEVKLFCFNGNVGFLTDNFEFNKRRFSNLYDRDLKFLNIKYGFENNKSLINNKNLSEFINIAEKLSKPFTFVRVDLYYVNNKIYFSELTFCPGGGMTPFIPDSFDYSLSKYFYSSLEEK